MKRYAAPAPMNWAPYWRGGNLAYSTFSPYGYSAAFYYGKVAHNW
ncbi:TonB-dependent receptor [Pseudomonas synxantha]|uniref:TonB-dependent receptor n=1 Tax=Pseudomonas synxantha TaxID=47883 RepID=A0A3G7UFE3_9PSED|nr:TonB-dependent receptor [Pseudomonas synxantha]